MRDSYESLENYETLEFKLLSDDECVANTGEEYDFDIHCKKSPIEHYYKMRAITRTMVSSSEDNEILENLFDFFVVGFLETFLLNFPMDFHLKCQLLTDFLKDINVDIGYSAHEILQSISSGNELETLTYQFVSGKSNDTKNFWILQGIVAQKGNCEHLCPEFFKENCSLMIGLAKKYGSSCPQPNLTNIALDLTSDFAKYLSELYKNGQ